MVMLESENAERLFWLHRCPFFFLSILVVGVVGVYNAT